VSAHGKAAFRAHAGFIGAVVWLAVPGLAGAADLETRIVRGPARVTVSRLAEFIFESDEPRASFECSLNSERFFPCASPLRLYSRIHLGAQYTLRIKARFGEREDPTPAAHTWRTLPGLPWQPVITEPAPGDSVKERMLSVAGLASPGGRIRVLLDYEPMAVTQADAKGEWRLTLPVDEGSHTLFAELEDGEGEAIAPTELVDFTVRLPAVEDPGAGGCSSTGDAPALLLIGLVALAIMNGRRGCQESQVSSTGCDCCR
jgi:hypothetical protein